MRILFMRILSFPGVCLMAALLLVVYGSDAAEEWMDGVKAFFDSLE